MKRRSLFIVGFFLSVVLSTIVLPSNICAEELIKVDAALRKIFPFGSIIDQKEITLSKDQLLSVEEGAEVSFSGAHSEKIKVYAVKDAQGVLGYAFEDTVVGKWGPIHYLVALNLEGVVLETVILDYQEIRGRKISKKRFLSQYKGKTVNDEVALRVDIDGITGATISSRSLTDGVRKILHIYDRIRSTLP